MIIHAGDVGGPEIIAALSELAPVVAIRGNVDRGAWARELPATAVAETASGLIYVLHDLKELDLDPVAAGFRSVVFGHSHQPSQKTERGVIYVNPGSAGPRRFHLPVTVARIDLRESSWRVSFADVLTGSVLDL